MDDDVPCFILPLLQEDVIKIINAEEQGILTKFQIAT